MKDERSHNGFLIFFIGFLIFFIALTIFTAWLFYCFNSFHCFCLFLLSLNIFVFRYRDQYILGYMLIYNPDWQDRFMPGF